MLWQMLVWVSTSVILMQEVKLCPYLTHCWKYKGCYLKHFLVLAFWKVGSPFVLMGVPLHGKNCCSDYCFILFTPSLIPVAIVAVVLCWQTHASAPIYVFWWEVLCSAENGTANTWAHIPFCYCGIHPEEMGRIIAKNGSVLDGHKSVIKHGLSQIIGCPYSMHWRFNVALVLNYSVCYISMTGSV